MSAAIASRVASAAARSISQNTRSMSTATSPAGSSWAWRNLSASTRRNVKLGLGTCGAVDAFVVYNYFPGWIGAGKKDA